MPVDKFFVIQDGENIKPLKNMNVSSYYGVDHELITSENGEIKRISKEEFETETNRLRKIYDQIHALLDL